MTTPDTEPLYLHFDLEAVRVAGATTPVSPLVESASSSACDSPIIESAYGGDEHFEQRLAYHPQDVTFSADSAVVPTKLRDSVRTSDDILGSVVASAMDHHKFGALDLAAAAISASGPGASTLGIDLAPDVCDEKSKTQAERERELHKEMASVERRQSLQSAPIPLAMHSASIASCPAATQAVSGLAVHSQMVPAQRRPSITFVNPFADGEVVQVPGDVPRGSACTHASPPIIAQPPFAGPTVGLVPGSPRRAVQAAAAEAASAAMHSLAQFTAVAEDRQMPFVPGAGFMTPMQAHGALADAIPARPESPGTLRRFSVAVPSAKNAISAQQLYGASPFVPMNPPIVSPGPARMPLQFVMEDPSSPATSKDRAHPTPHAAHLYMRPPAPAMPMAGTLAFHGAVSVVAPPLAMPMSALHAAAMSPLDSVDGDCRDDEDEERDGFAAHSGSQVCDDDDSEAPMVMMPDGELMSVVECGVRRHSMGAPHLYCCPWTGCGKIFNRFYNLRSHYRIHSGEKPYVCGNCDASFARNHDLKRHERIHSKDRPFVCEICNKSFSRNDALSRHLRLNSCNVTEQPA